MTGFHITTDEVEGYHISTVYLPVLSEFAKDPYETMVFAKVDGLVDYSDLYCRRCSSEQEALEQHAEAIRIYKEKEKKMTDKVVEKVYLEREDYDDVQRRKQEAIGFRLLRKKVSTHDKWGWFGKYKEGKVLKKKDTFQVFDRDKKIWIDVPVEYDYTTLD